MDKVLIKYSGRSPQSALLEAVFCQRGWLSEAEPALRDNILGLSHIVCFARGARLFAQGDRAGGLFGVISGGIGLESSSKSHPMRLGHIVRAGYWFGEGPAVGLDQRTLGAIAVEDSKVAHVPLGALQAAAQTDGPVLKLLAALTVRNTLTAIWTVNDLLIPEAPRRIAAVLLRVTAVRDGVKPSHPDGFLLNQSVLAELSSASRAHVNRVLGLFEASGWILKRYNHLQILNQEALAEFAYSED